MEKLVSVIIPAYNVEKYIKTAIFSVQKQTYAHWELLIVDDGSTDATKNKILEMSKSDSRIHLLNQVNSGSAHARNTGLEHAKGNYIAFLDGDDLWEPTFLEELLAAKKNAGLAMAYCGYAHLYSLGIKRGFGHKYASGDVLLASINGHYPIHIGCTLVDKKLYDTNNLRFTDGCLIGQDREFILKLIALTKVVALPKELMLYRVRNDSAIHSKWQWQKHIHAIYGARRARTIILQQRSGQRNYNELSIAFTQRIAYQWSKFLWRMIKKGYHEEVLNLMDNPEYNLELRALDKTLLTKKEQLQANIVLSRNLGLWKFLSKIPII